MPDSEIDDFHRLIERQSPAVLPIRCERVEAIHHRKDAGANRNLFARKAERITRSVPFLVMRAHDRNHRIREFHLFQNLRADQRMDLHLLELFGSQPAGFRDDVFGHRQFADIVQQSGCLQGIELVLTQPDFLADLGGIDADALQMVGRCGVLGFDGKRECFDGPQV